MSVCLCCAGLLLIQRQADVLPLRAESLGERTGLYFPVAASAKSLWGKLQAMNIAPVQDAGMALQWHLMPWPNPWFERFPLTLDQNLNSARGGQRDENVYWIQRGEAIGHSKVELESCPKVMPKTPSTVRVWDSALINSGRTDGSVWLSDSMVELTHFDLRGLVHVAPSSGLPPLPPDSHGTHVAGLMSARKNAEGTVGVMPGLEIQLFPLRLYTTSQGQRISAADVIASLDHMVDMLSIESPPIKKGRTILLSWSFYESDHMTAEFLEQLRLRLERILMNDVAVVVPSGNAKGMDKVLDQKIYPAIWAKQFEGLPGVLLPVGALDVCSRPAWFSQLARNELGTVLMAPGERIYSTLTKNDHGYLSGTSAAAAQVAAVLAMTANQYPEVAMKAQVHTLLRTSVALDPLEDAPESLVSFDAPSFVQGLMTEFGWIARQ